MCNTHKTAKDYIPGYASIIIPVYEDWKGLEDTLLTLAKTNSSQEPYEIIVCNDGNSDKIDALCKRFRVKEVRILSNKGSYYARNRGIEIAKGEYIGFVDADIKVNANWIKNGIDYMKKYDYVTGPVDIDKEKVVTLTEKYELYTALNMKRMFINSHYAATANLWVKHSAFDQEGLFDERLWSSGDKEFGRRIHGTNRYKTGYEDGLAVVHPPRNLAMLKKKQKRVAEGTVDLTRLYPNQYKRIKKTECLFNAFFKPWKLSLKMQCSRLDKFLIYCIHRYIFFLFNYYMMRYLTMPLAKSAKNERDLETIYADYSQPPL